MTPRSPLLRKRAIIIWAGTVVLMVSCIWLSADVVLQQRQADRLASHIAAAQVEAMLYQRVQAMLPTGTAPARIGLLRAALGRRLTQDRTMGEIQELAHRYGVQVLRESFNKPLALRGGYARMDLDLEVSGDYRQLVGFLLASQDAYYLATFRQLSLMPAERGGGVVAQVGLSLFGVLSNGT